MTLDAASPGMARVEIQGVTREVNVTLIEDELAVGDWVLVHLGFAMERLEPETAAEWLSVFEQAAG